MIIHQEHNSLGNHNYNAFFYENCDWFYHFHKNYWRQCFGSEAAKAVRDWFFENTAYDSVYSYMTEANIPSQATAAANGMKKIKAYLDKDNTVTCVYEITRQDWTALLLDRSV